MNALELLLLNDEEKANGIWLGEEDNSERKSWYKNGRIAYHCQWKNNRRHGIRKFWGSNGTMLRHEEWDNGELVRDFLRDRKGWIGDD